MANLAAHGGSCCGMRHIYNFRDDQNENVRSLTANTMLQNAHYANGNYQLEVILSDRQTRENPRLVDELARLGYVYTSSWTGQHGTPVHLFLRATRRLALTEANFYNRWVTDLNGMLPHPALSGRLPEAPVQNNNANWYRNNRQLDVGTRVENVIPGGRRTGEFAVVTRAYDGFDYQIRYEIDNYVATFTNPGSVRIVPPVQQEAPAPEREPQVFRHPTNPVFAPVAGGNLNPRRLILSQFYCVFRATGQASRVFPTLAAAQAAYPRAQDWHERKVYSDGEIVEGPVQHG